MNINYTNFNGMGRTTDAEFLNSSYAQLFDNTTFDSSGNVTHMGTDEENRNAITFLDLIGTIEPTGGRLPVHVQRQRGDVPAYAHAVHLGHQRHQQLLRADPEQ